MYKGYLRFNETEIGNNERVLAYLAGKPFLGIKGMAGPYTSVERNCGCETARPFYCDQGSGVGGEYLSPALDGAPWFDPDVPASAEFAGLFIEDVTGFDSVVRRDLSSGAISGGSLGPLRLDARSLTVTGWLRAKTCCGAEYGLNWLQEALIGNLACDNCALGDLYMLRCCPTCACFVVGQATQFSGTRSYVVTQTGPRQWSVTIVDLGLTGLLCDNCDCGEGCVCDSDGPLLACLASGGSPGWSGTISWSDDSDPPMQCSYDFTWLWPGSCTTITSDDDGCSPRTVTFALDLSCTSDCPDVQAAIDNQQAAFEEFIASVGGTDGSGFGTLTCYTEVDCASGGGSSGGATDIPRLLHRVGLIDGPNVTEKHGNCCTSNCGCINLRVQFTLASEIPYIFSDLSWCLLDQPFDTETGYCFDLSTLCIDCADTIGTKTVTQEVARPTVGVTLRADGTWCPDGGPFICPPVDTVIEVSGTTPSEGSSIAIKSGTAPTKECEIALGFFNDWTAVNFDVAPGTFPGQDCGTFTLTPNPCTPPASTCVAGSNSPKECIYFGNNLFLFPGGGPFIPTNWDPAVNGFPPTLCDLRSTSFPFGCPPVPPEWNATTAYTPGQRVQRFDLYMTCLIANTGVDPLAFSPFWSAPCTLASAYIPIRVTWDKCNNTMVWEVIGPDPIGPCILCYVFAEFCTIDAPEQRLVRIVYNECTGTQSWEPMGWTGTLLDACKCYAVGEVKVIALPATVDPCNNPVVRSVNIICAGQTWLPDWPGFDECAPFPEPNATYVVGRVNGFPQDTSTITRSFEVPADTFIPDCGPLIVPPPPPLQLLSQCYCEPWCSVHACCTFENKSDWNDVTTYIEVAAGGSDIRNMKISAYKNQFAGQGMPCPCDPATDDFWRCREPCSVIEIPQIPSGSRLIIDSQSRIAELQLVGGQNLSGLRYISAANGAPFEWFDVSQCATLCIIVSVDCAVSPDARVSIGAAGRYLASGG